MADLIQNFRNDVAKLLNCDHAAKERLLASFDKNIAAPFMEANEEADPEVLHATLGTPQTVANVLMEQLTEEAESMEMTLDAYLTAMYGAPEKDLKDIMSMLYKATATSYMFVLPALSPRPFKVVSSCVAPWKKLSTVVAVAIPKSL